eukprot:jgi/Undpi1/2049/HiC_scaffold_12.g05435.m1
MPKDHLRNLRRRRFCLLKVAGFLAATGHAKLAAIFRRAHSIKQQQPGSERFAHQFNGDFSGIGISLDVDEDGRLVVQHVDENGEAAKKCPELGKGDLHIVSVGIVNKNEKVEADELLRQLMTLPRPVRVEFARTTDTASPGAEEKARAGTEKARVGAKQPVKKRQQPGKKRREYITARKKWLRG